MNIRYLLFSVICILFLSCSQDKANSTEEASAESILEVPSNRNIKENELSKEQISAEDSAFIKSIIQELNGIEKFAIQKDFYLLSSLLEFKGDSTRHKKVKAILIKKDEHLRSYLIEELDIKSGYIRYAPRAAEVTYTVTYWNLDDGSKLIATESWGCGPFCQSEISFHKFKDGQYHSIENLKIIPEIEKLPQLLVPNYSNGESDPYEFKYLLPRNGKNIKYCLDEKCIELVWENEVFTIK